MFNLIKDGTSNTFAINPATSSNYWDLVSGSFRLNITQDYDQSSGSLDLDKLPPIPQGYYSNYLLFSVASSLIPSASGNYSYTLQEGIRGSAIWGQVSQTWAAADFTWNETGPFLVPRDLDTGRLRVVGTDIPSYITYTDADQDGQYTTYHK